MSKNSMPNAEVEEIAQMLTKTQLLMRFHRPPKPSKNLASLTIQQMRCLFIVTRHENCTLSELSRELAVRPSTASESVERLVRAGFIKRVADKDDRRTVRLNLTGKGRALHERHERHRQEQIRALLEGMNRKQRMEMKSALEVLNSVMQQIEAKQEKTP